MLFEFSVTFPIIQHNFICHHYIGKFWFAEACDIFNSVIVNEVTHLLYYFANDEIFLTEVFIIWSSIS
jgi:hypothetical protein